MKSKDDRILQDGSQYMNNNNAIYREISWMIKKGTYKKTSRNLSNQHTSLTLSIAEVTNTHTL